MTSQNFPKMRLTERHHTAASLVAADDLTDEQIAAEVGITRRQLTTWKRHPDFGALVQQHLEAFRRRVESRGIASRYRRVASQDERWRRLQRVIDERAADVDSGTYVDEVGEDRTVPGWGTGLLVRQEKPHGIEFAVDTGLLKEMRELEKHAATELGQWSEKHDHTITVQLRQEIERLSAELGLDVDEVLAEATSILSEPR